MFFRNIKKNQNRLDAFLSFDEKSKTFNEVINLFNEITSLYSNKVIAIAAVNDDYSSSVIAIALSNALALNKKTSLIIDANLYNPTFPKILEKLNVSQSSVEKGKTKKQDFLTINDKVKAICLTPSPFPSEAFKDGVVKKTITENSKKFDHIFVISPNVEMHTDIVILAENVDCILLVSQRDVTEKSRIFKTIQTIKENKLTLAKVLVIK